MRNIIYEKIGHVAFIKLNRPEKLNALNRAMAEELAKVWQDFRDDKNLWVGILSGEGRAFCAGADISELEVGGFQLRKSLLFGEKNRIIPSAYGVWKPIVAVVHGYVYGAGFFLALECDMRIAGASASFGIPEGKVGLVTLFAPFLTNYMPRGIAMELLLTGEPLSAERAYQVGIVNRVVPDSNLDAEARRVAEIICDNSPLAQWATKELVNRACGASFDIALGLIEHIGTPIYNLEDTMEAKRAFQEKRKPKWQLK